MKIFSQEYCWGTFIAKKPAFIWYITCCLHQAYTLGSWLLVVVRLDVIRLVRPPYYHIDSGGMHYICGPHDDVIKWKHFLRYWPYVRGINRATVSSPHKGQRRRALIFCLICAWINHWVNNREAGDLRRHRAQYDVIVMVCYRKVNLIGWASYVLSIQHIMLLHI